MQSGISLLNLPTTPTATQLATVGSRAALLVPPLGANWFDALWPLNGSAADCCRPLYRRPTAPDRAAAWNTPYADYSVYAWLHQKIRGRLNQTGLDPVSAAIGAHLGVVRENGLLRLDPVQASKTLTC